MNNNNEILKKALELINTMIEGIEYIEEKLKNLEIEKTINIIGDIIEAFQSIQNAIEIIDENLYIEEEMEQIKHGLTILVEDYEKNQARKASNIIQNIIKPNLIKSEVKIKENLKKADYMV